MTRYFSHKRLAICVLLILAATFIGFSVFSMDEPVYVKSDPQQIDHRFRLFETQNVWTFLLLDTSSGRVWQVQYSTNNEHPRLLTPINEEKLTPPHIIGRVGRFTLHPTHNMWNFLLLDREDGNVYQCQFSIGTEYPRFITPIR